MNKIKVGDLVCLRGHKSFFTKPHLAEAFGTGHISVGIVTKGPYEESYCEGYRSFTYVDVFWQKRGQGRDGRPQGPGERQKPHALAKL